MMQGKTLVVLGTRPEIIKLAPVLKELEKRDADFVTVHSGQHYSYELDRIFFEQLGLKKPDQRLDVKSSAPYKQGQHTGRMMEKLEELFLREKPANVVAEGDTNTVLAAALVSAKIGTVRQLVDFAPRFGHVEAGLRSYDKSMPEEMNRVLADHLSDLLFAPTETSKRNALEENIPEEKIFVTGNTVVDALKMVDSEIEKSPAMENLSLERKKFALLTVHRQENADVKERLREILAGVSDFGRKTGLEVVWPVHPRAEKMLKYFKVKVPKNIKAVKPQGFFEFLQLEKNAVLALTDSGGVQEETCVLGTPCVTLRDNTERPETVEIGANAIAGWKRESVLENALKMLENRKKWKQPFGSGNAGRKIVDILFK